MESLEQQSAHSTATRASIDDGAYVRAAVPLHEWQFVMLRVLVALILDLPLRWLQRVKR
jgi:hypothetical protein